MVAVHVGSSMAKRVIMRIELSSDARRKFENTPVSLGMTQIAVSSKLIEWFVGQDENMQGSILGWYPEWARQDLAAAVLKRLISDA